MVMLDILTIPDERLKHLSEPVTDFDQALVEFVSRLEQTRQQGPAAVGIAAPQVGHFQRIAIVDCSNTRRPVPNHGNLVLINPEITHWEGYDMGREGCLSVPDYTGNVIRAIQIKLKALDPSGETHEYEMEGYEARAVQHEIDHLDGTLFIDRVVSRRTDLFKRKVYK
jgi:peptide deformylase